MNKSLFLPVVIIVLATFSCKNTKSTSPASSEDSAEAVIEESTPVDPEHNSQTSLDWPGRYNGTLPCADCEGISISLAIQEDGAYYRTIHYLGRNDEPVLERGKFQWNSTGNYIRLQLPNSLVQWYMVSEGLLYHLDDEGKKIKGDMAEKYILIKEYSDAELENKQWTLIEINGESAEGAGALRNPHLKLDGVRKRVTGNDGCNSYSGEFEIETGNKINFGLLASTEMFCEGDSISTIYYQALEKVDRYKVSKGMMVLSAAGTDLLKFRQSTEE